MKKLQPVFILQIIGNVLLVAGIVLMRKSLKLGLPVLGVSMVLNMIFIFKYMKKTAAEQQSSGEQ